MEFLDIFLPKHGYPEEKRRAKLVLILLFSSALFALACLFIYLGLSLFTRIEHLEKNIFTVFICTGILLIAVPLVGIINYFLSSRISSITFLAVLFIVITIFSLSGDYLNGYGLFWYAIPIVFASFILFSSCSFLAALVSSAIVITATLITGTLPNFMAITGFFIIALISFFSVKSMDNVVRKLEAARDKLQQELEERKKSQETAINDNKAKNVFLSNVTHEIRTPMSAILGISKYLTENHAENLSPDQKEGLVMIYQSCRKLLLIVNEMMELSRIEAGDIDVFYNYFSLSDMTKELKDSINSLIEHKDLIIYFQVDSNLPDKIFSDRKKIYQILFTIISNLIKLSEKGEIIVHIYKAEKHIHFELKAIDIIIPEQQMKSLNQKFQANGNDQPEVYSSIGLGLALCHKIIELLNGKIEIISSSEKETIIQFLLPFLFKKET